jgi:hypothetical protein
MTSQNCCLSCRLSALSNIPDQRPGATDPRLSIRPPSPGSLDLVCSARRTSYSHFHKRIGYNTRRSQGSPSRHCAVSQLNSLAPKNHIYDARTAFLSNKYFNSSGFEVNAV